MRSVQMLSGPTWGPRTSTSRPTSRGRRREGAIGARRAAAGPEPAGLTPGRRSSNSVLHDDVRIEEGAKVHDAVVLEGGYVRAGAVVRPFGPGPQRGRRPGRSSRCAFGPGRRLGGAAGDCPERGRLPGRRFDRLVLEAALVGRLASRASGDQVDDEPCPAGLVGGSQPGAGVAVEVLVEPDEVPPAGSSWSSGLSPWTGRRPSGPGRNSDTSRRERSSATSRQGQWLPDPTGCSTFSSSPKYRL